MASKRPKILCVDDEPMILEAFSHYLRRRYQLATAESGHAALEILDNDRDFCVIISDLSMPKMLGTEFLSRARERAPEASRILLTGNADVPSAIDAINNGQIFRFLTKPCPMPKLLESINAGVEQHRLITAEKVLLQKTLLGSIQTLTDVLSMTKPLAFGRATRLKTLAVKVALAMGVESTWQLEAAAMLSQLGCITLTDSLANKLYYGHKLNAEEIDTAKRITTVAAELLANIPRMESVGTILNRVHEPWKTGEELDADDEAVLLRQSALILKAVMDFDTYEARERAADLAMESLLANFSTYSPDVLRALREITHTVPKATGMGEVRRHELKVGMIFAADVLTPDGQLLIARGFRISPSLLERVQRFPDGKVQEPMYIQVDQEEEN